MVDPDPIVMYLVVRESLEMSPGKIGAQCGHAVMLLMQLYHETPEGPAKQMAKDWLATNYVKVTVRASDAEWEKVKLEHPLYEMAVDLGRTEVPSGSETVMALWPMLRSSRGKTTRRLRLY